MATNSRIRGLDGIRAIAALLVFAEHQFWPAVWMMSGKLGVELFFALSGYLIVGILSSKARQIERGETNSGAEVSRFFLHRAFRIFPAYYAFIAIISVFLLMRGVQPDFQRYPMYATYLTNLGYAYYYKDWPQGFNFGHFWSLAVEEQFYLFVAPLLLWISPQRHRAACLALLALSAAAIFVIPALGYPWFSVEMDSIVNFGYLALGGLISQMAKTADGRDSRVIWLAVAGCLACFGIAAALRPTGGAAIAMAVSMGLISAVVVWQVVRNQGSAVVRWLEIKPLVALGRISYAFYLWHIMVRLPPTGIAYRNIDLIIVGNLVVSIGLAWLSWVLLEKPMLDLRARISASPARERAAAAVTPV